MNILDYLEVWADDNGLYIQWGNDDNEPLFYDFTLIGMKASDRALLDDFEFFLDSFSYKLDVAYETRDGVEMSISAIYV